MLSESSEGRFCACGQELDIDGMDTLCDGCWEDATAGMDLEDQLDVLLGGGESDQEEKS